MKVTLEMIAQEIGTTKNTVSRALSGKTGVSEELRNKIIEQAKLQGYQQKVKEEPTMPTKITMVCNSSMPSDIYFWPTVISGIFEYSAKHQISTHSVIVDMVEDNVKSLLPLQEKHCDGILVIGTLPDATFKRIAELKRPMVVLDHYSHHVECDYINVANENGTIKAVDFLYNHGHRRIGFINNETATYTYSLTKRYNGYKKRMEELALTVDSRFVWAESKYKDLQYFRDKLDMFSTVKDTPSAWVCANDVTGYNFCAILRERGIRVPDDISLVGFDNIPGVFHTQLTTLDVPQSNIGAYALKRLMRRIHKPDEPFENIEIFTRLLEKESVRVVE